MIRPSPTNRSALLRSRSGTRLIAILGALLVLMGAAVPIAGARTPLGEQEPLPAGEEPSRSDIDAHVAAARKAFEEHRFADASEELKLAYQLEPRPMYLFNAGQSYRKAGLREKALETYEHFLRVAPKDHPLIGEATGYSNELRANLDAQKKLEEVKLNLESDKKQAEAEKQQLLTEKQRVELEKQKAEEALKKERQKPIYKRTGFIVGMTLLSGVVVVAGLVTLVPYLRAKADGPTVMVTF